MKSPSSASGRPGSSQRRIRGNPAQALGAMLFHFVGDLITAPPGSMRKVLIDEPYPDLGPELDLSGPVTGFARLHRIQHAILVQCDLSAPIDCECARCLQPMTHTMQTHFDEEFRFSGHEVEPDSFRLREQHLDLTEAA